MSASFKNNSGFTLIELSSAVISAGILLLSFFSLMVYSHRETGNINEEARALGDMLVAEELFSTFRITYPADSVKIYNNENDEQSGSESNTGKILIANSEDGKEFRASGTGTKLIFSMNETDQVEFDRPLTNLNFAKEVSPVTGKVILKISLGIEADDRTINSEWSYVFRN